ncbi:MAG: hypothetical protein GXY86_00615 [Firmicutes bacterium]|nr:hypothetical protein [Bacillota bacterium]
MQTYIDLDKWVPEKLTMKINGETYDVKDITVEMFLEILQLCELGVGPDPSLTSFIDELKKAVKKNWVVRAIDKIQRLIRRGKPISEDEGKKKLARFLKKAVPDLPMPILRAMSQAQIQGFLEFLIQSYYAGQTDPNFQKPMASL